MVQKETPLRDYKLGAGMHQFRFINGPMHFDSSKAINVPSGGELTISVDVSKNSIAIQ